jgi:predicted SAM-dependent methyltransferase
MSTEQVFLHVGCGPLSKPHTTQTLAGPGWREVRLDIDPRMMPDILGTMTDMTGVATASVDAVFSSHNIEHLFAHEVPVALAEFSRVLRPDGFVVITCPDLQSVAALIAEDRLMDTAYMSPAGPITPIDILYGHRQQIAEGNLFMAHRCGFTRRVLEGTIRAAGFVAVASVARPAPYFDLWAVALKRPSLDAELRALADAHIPPP